VNIRSFRSNNRQGFTLIELLVVVSIIGVLTAIAIPKYTEVHESAKRAKIMADLRTMDSAIIVYYATNTDELDKFHTAQALYNKGLLASRPEPPATVKSPDGTVYTLTTSHGYVRCTETVADKATKNRAIVKLGNSYYDVDHLKSELNW
jgi:prepilin-type N-terminal cleavage/methylation domain-containing protein